MKILLLLSTLLLISGALIIPEIQADVISPYRQLKSGIPVADIVCNEDLVRMTESTNSKVICIKAQSEEFFMNRGWTKLADNAPQVEEIADSVKTIRVIKGENLGAKKSATSTYDYVFEVCAGATTLVAPEIIIKTDVETKSVILSKDIPSNSCLKSVESVKAVNADSIRSEISKQDDIVAKIASIKDEINVKTQQLEDEKKNFAQILQQPNSEEKKAKLDESTTKITTLRQAMNDIKDDLNRYYFISYGSSKASSPTKLSFDGTAINGSSVRIISSAQAPKTDGVFDVVLELCAGGNAISTPIIELSSDSKQDILKLTAVASNSCYKTGAKIDASSPDTITAKFADSVTTIATLEAHIKSSNEKLEQKRFELIQLTENTSNPDKKEIRQISNEIIALRDNIVKAKFDYYQSLYKAYK